MKIFDYISESKHLEEIFPPKAPTQGNLFEEESLPETTSEAISGFEDFLNSILECQEMMRENFYFFFKFVIEKLGFVDFVEKN